MFRIEYPFKEEILACGTEQHAGFCLTKKNSGFIVSKLGDLSDDAAFEHYQQEIERLSKELKIKPRIIAHQLQKGECRASIYAQDLAQKSRGLKYFPVQHHYAHIASCMGENALKDKVIAVVFDGGGLGEDGQIWGGEFLVGDLQGFKRAAHLKYTPLLNLFEPASIFLHQTFGEAVSGLEIDFVRKRNEDNWRILRENIPGSLTTSSMAFLFDAVYILLNMLDKVNYESQGAVELQKIVNRSSHVAGKIYRFKINKNETGYEVCSNELFRDIVEDLKKYVSKSIISAAFHNAVIEMIMDLCRKIRQKEKIQNLILTGNVFTNKVLFNRAKDLLAADGFNLITHRHFSCNDNDIAFGQAVLANARLGKI